MARALRRTPSRPLRPARDERGATAILVAMVLAVVMVVAAFVVDLGMQRVLRRDLQSVVDVVALDLARELTGRKAGDYGASERATIDAAKAASLHRNRDLVGGEVPAADVRWELVVLSDGEWRPAAASEIPGGVRVTARSDVAFAFGGFTGVESGGAERTAVAATRTSACLRVGSYAAQLDTGQSWLLNPLLGGLLGSDLALKVLDPQAGLAGVGLNLLDLIDELDPLVSADISAASFTQAAGVSVGLAELMLAAVKVLERQSDRLAEVDLLREVYGGIQANLPAVGIELGDLVRLATADDAAADLDLDLLDLVAGSLAIANGTNVVRLPLAVRLPLPIGPGGTSLVDLKASVKVGQKPVVACPTATSSQVEITLAGDALALDLGVIAVRAPLTIRLTVADASATVTAVECLPAGRRIKMLVDSGLLGVDVRLGQRADDPASPKLSVSLLGLGIPGWNGVEVVSGTVALASGGNPNRPVRAEQLDIVDDDYDVSVPIRQGGLGVPDLFVSVNSLKLLGGLGPLSDLLTFLGIPSLLQWVVDLVLQGIVNPLKNSLDKWLLGPLLTALGADVAGGTVTAVPKVDCGTPRLAE
ncbi:pilus assembly protein TadG-related protein [Nocardioides nitrophenolicus]|uniref:pilus assembly protein TadG-related protein n=1 Tax=Nocardioides nitrophenolicus TaxID=60489 RepID=UPI0019587D9F|nr:pilus assembly protein TadG-related protein [Nocardioides nitrophenolicus]MBM7518456.1 putative membrane protein [Nocardioides nitrophenolicus]